MAKKRTTRKELVKKPDEFITQTGKVIQWAQENTKPLVYGVCIFFGLVILVSGYRMYNSARMKAASTLLSSSLDAYEKAAEGAKDPGDVLAQVSTDFDKLVNKYGGQPEGRLGGVLYAHIALAGADTDDAIKYYEKAYKQYGSDATLSNIVLNGLAVAHMEKGENDAAINYLTQIANGNSKLFKDNALFYLGSLYEKTGQTDKSVEYMEQLTKDFPDSIYADIAREKSAV